MNKIYWHITELNKQAFYPRKAIGNKVSKALSLVLYFNLKLRSDE